jgi:hypothetical protein
VPATSPNAVRVAVITGGHSYQVPEFHHLWRGLAGLDVFVQHLDDFASSPPEVREAYDVVVFYIMMMEGPSDENLPWYSGQPRAALGQLGATAQGIVVLHHALLAYPEWELWTELTGLADRKFGYYAGETVHSQVADPNHPITRDLAPWTMTDETYTMPDCAPDSRVLITYDHPRSMRTIAWTRHFRQSRVFCYEAGHDNQTWVEPNFREVLRRGVLWTADGQKEES